MLLLRPRDLGPQPLPVDARAYFSEAQLEKAQSFQYSNSFRLSDVRQAPAIQRVYGPSGVGSSTFQYFGTP